MSASLGVSISNHYVTLIPSIATADAQKDDYIDALMEDLVFIYWGDCPSVAEPPSAQTTEEGASATHGQE